LYLSQLLWPRGRIGLFCSSVTPWPLWSYQYSIPIGTVMATHLNQHFSYL
jgi:hypothetical protein